MNFHFLGTDFDFFLGKSALTLTWLLPDLSDVSVLATLIVILLREQPICCFAALDYISSKFEGGFSSFQSLKVPNKFLVFAISTGQS